MQSVIRSMENASSACSMLNVDSCTDEQKHGDRKWLFNSLRQEWIREESIKVYIRIIQAYHSLAGTQPLFLTSKSCLEIYTPGKSQAE